MDVIEKLKDIPHYDNLVITLGNFDGIHLGHRELIRRTIELSEAVHGTPAAFTFDPHPLAVLKPKLNLPLLLTKEEKIKMLSDIGIKVLVIAPFSEELSCLSPDDFVKHILIEKLKAKKIVVGYNYSFGCGGTGTAQLMADLTFKYGIETEIIPPVIIDGIEVSSTVIRGLIFKGETESAAKLLGYSPFIRAQVVYGEQRGRKLGYPTANLNLPDGMITPANGVYAVRISMQDGMSYYGVANIGTKPTFKNNDKKNLEIHIFDFQKDIYGHVIKVEFLRNIRGERKFTSAEELVNQINNDALDARNYIASVTRA